MDFFRPTSGENSRRDSGGSGPHGDVYDDLCHSIPIAHQIQRIHEKRLTARVFPGDVHRGQTFVHLDDMIDAIVRTIERRAQLPPVAVVVIGEPVTASYDTLQRTIGQLLHGEEWTTREIPKPVAKAGAAVQDALPGIDPFIHTTSVWDPFFGDGTQRVLISGISEWFPVSDAGLGALSYLLDAIAGLIGGTRRWRTMPWMVLLFGFFIIPPGVTSIALVILQPIGVGAWCSVCLITAVVMLLMVPPAIDEVIASTQFLLRVRRAGGRTWRAFWRGEGDAGESSAAQKANRSPWTELLHGVEIFSSPRTLWLSALAGAWWLAAPAVLGMEGNAARNDYIVGALVVTFAVIAGAEPVRAARFANVVLGGWMLAAPWLLAGGTRASTWNDVATGLAVIALSLPRGRVDDHYGSWDRWIR